VAYRRLHLAEGFVEYVVDGPADARDLLVFHVGTPAAAVTHPPLVEAAARAGLRLAGYSRGGYGASPRRAGRTVADEAAITAALADRLGHRRFFVIGWSGGGPPALACAALLPDRVAACTVLASPAPRVEGGAAWRAMQSPDELAEWDAMARGDIDPFLPEFEAAATRFRRMTPRRLASVGGPPDARAVAFEHTRVVLPGLVRGMRRAVSRGHLGYLDDTLAHARDWGFRVADIRVPVIVRHGALDRLVPVANGRWLADAIPSARGVFLDDAGHGSIALPWSEVVSELVTAAR
jgi:pimeloyl-ACP methyl ester carboxylesterase